MKKLLFTTALLILSNWLIAQTIDENYKAFHLAKNIPEHLSSGFKNLDSLECKTIPTGVDSLKMTFGRCYRNGKKLYWLSFKNGDLSSTNWFGLETHDSTELESVELEKYILEYKTKIAFRFLRDPKNDEFYYSWLKNGKTTKGFVVQEINNPIKLGEKMPEFKVETIDHKEISLNDLSDNWVVINWWATNCAPCIQEMPGLNKLVEKHSSNEQIKFIAIAHDERTKWENFLSKREFKYEQALSNELTKSIFGELYPINLIIDPNGIVKFYEEGGYENMYLEIDEALVDLSEK